MYHPKETDYSLRDDLRVSQPKVKSTTFGLNSLRYSGSVLWNNLPNDIKSCTDEKMFRKLIKLWNGPTCACGFCVLCKVHNH